MLRLRSRRGTCRELRRDLAVRLGARERAGALRRDLAEALAKAGSFSEGGSACIRVSWHSAPPLQNHGSRCRTGIRGSTRQRAIIASSWYAHLVRALGIDYGRRRIGLALSDATGLLARPWKTIPLHGNTARIAAALAAIVEDLHKEADGLSVAVLGLPRRLSGEPNEQTIAVQDLAARLGPMIPVPLMLQDERLSSREAESLLARRERDWRKRKARLDSAAAAVILQDYLDDCQARSASDTHPPEPFDRKRGDESS